MKDTKKRLEQFAYYDVIGIADHLEKMAAKGWMLESISSNFWRYRRCEPQKMHFAVVFYHKASEFDPKPSEGQQTFWEYCESTGWKHITNRAQMQIFANEKENPLPIETDPVVQVDQIHKTMKKNYLLTYWILLVIALMDVLLLCVTAYQDVLFVLSNNSNLFTGFCWICLALLWVTELGGYYSWRRRAKHEAQEHGVFLPGRSHRKFQYGMLAILLAALLLGVSSLLFKESGLMCVLVLFLMPGMVIGIVCLVKKSLKRLNVKASVNRVMTIAACAVLTIALTGGITFGTIWAVTHGYFTPQPADTYSYEGNTKEVYHDQLPLQLEDLMETDVELYSQKLRTTGSILIVQYEATENPRMDSKNWIELPSLAYTITQPKLHFLTDLCREEIKKSHTYQEKGMEKCLKLLENTDWGADEVYQQYSFDSPDDTYVVFSGNKILEISFYWEPTPEQLEKAINILLEAEA